MVSIDHHGRRRCPEAHVSCCASLSPVTLTGAPTGGQGRRMSGGWQPGPGFQVRHVESEVGPCAVRYGAAGAWWILQAYHCLCCIGTALQALAGTWVPSDLWLAAPHARCAASSNYESDMMAHSHILLKPMLIAAFLLRWRLQGGSCPFQPGSRNFEPSVLSADRDF